MLAKSALLIAVCLTCVSCYSVGDSFFKRLSGRASEVCADGQCTCNPGETCCQNDGHYCCPVKDGTCCEGSDSCCPNDKPQCAHCAGPEIPLCCAANAKCCGTSCCSGTCTFGFCIGGKESAPAIPKVKRPNGSKDQCISGTTSPGQTTTTGAGTTTMGPSSSGTTTPLMTTTAMPGTTTTAMPDTTTTTAMPDTTTTPAMPDTSTTPAMPDTTTTTAMPDTTTTTAMPDTTTTTAMPDTTTTAVPDTTTTSAPGTTTTVAGQQKDCAGWKKAGSTTNGVYSIVTSSGPLQVYCDMTTEGGGWIVFQRRKDGSQDFAQNWASYTAGFGDLKGEFWLGNSHVSDISLADTQTLRVELTDCQENSYTEVYSQFVVGNEMTNFTLHLNGTAAGTAGDSLMYQCPGRFCQNGMQFTTIDRDNDNLSFGNCAIFQKGAWWYNGCGVSDLNGLYHPTCICNDCSPYQTGIYWHSYKNNGGDGYSFKTTEVKIRPASFTP